MTAVPKGAKTPADRKPKAATAKRDVDGRATVEFHGHTYDIDMRAADDIDIMDLMAEAKTTGDGAAMMAALSAMMSGLLGDQYSRWKAEQKAIHGRVGSEVVNDFLQVAGAGNY